MSGAVTLQSNAITGFSGQKQIGPLTLSGSGEILAITDVVLAVGFNSVPVPPGATYGIVVPPTTNAQTLTLKGVTGDTGIPQQAAQPWLVSIATPGTGNTIGITLGAGSSVTVEINWW